MINITCVSMVRARAKSKKSAAGNSNNKVTEAMAAYLQKTKT